MKYFIPLTLALSLAWTACQRAPERLQSGSSDGSNSGDADGDVYDGKDKGKNPGGGGASGGGSGGGETITDEEGNVFTLNYSTGFPRLSHVQWDNSVRDILLLDQSPDLSKNFAADPTDSIYNNNQSFLKVSSTLWSDYRDAAESIAATVSGNAALMQKLTPASLPTDALAKAKAIVTPIIRRAFRRPPKEDEINKFAEYFKDGLKYSEKKDANAAGFEAFITALLQSPQFIYRPEQGDASTEDAIKLSAYEVASRLSYAVYNSIPDEELLKAAEAGTILKEDGLRKEVERMMKDKRAQETIEFWLYKAFNLAKYRTAPKKDTTVYPKWPQDIGNALETEALMYLNDVVVKNEGGLKEILLSDYTFVNDKTAPLYGVAAPNGANFAKVQLDKTKRLGFLTQLGYLATRAHTAETDPIHRGTFITGEILCTVLAVPPVTEKVPPPSETLKTVRERVSALTNAGSCAGCHSGMINPAGFAFENYDGVGGWQEIDNGVKIDPSGEYKFINKKDGTIKFDTALGLIQALAGKEAAHICYAQKALEMLYGRLPDPNGIDKARLANLSKKSIAGASTQELFVELLSDPTMLVRSNKAEAK